MEPATIDTAPAVAGETQPSLVRGLSLMDAVLLLVGGIIGSSIFLTSTDIAGPLPHPFWFLLVWVFGGLVSICACFAFAEFASMFPDSGGQYVFLRKAFGDLIAFLYGWMMFTVSNGGTIAALSVAAAVYLGRIVPAVSPEYVIFSGLGIVFTRAHLFAIVAIAFVTWINAVGLRQGAMLQNIATWGKVAAMAVFVVLGLAIGKGNWGHFAPAQWGTSGLMMGMGPGQFLSALGVGLIAVFWAYDGWVYITWVAGEVKNPRRNVPLAMLLGVLFVGVVYITMNVVYIYALPGTEIQRVETVAHAAASAMFSPSAAIWLSALVALSCFGAAASCILSSGRIYYAMARDGVFFRRMAKIHPKWNTPAFALIGQGIWACILTLSGRYDQLYTYVMFMMVLFYVLTVVGLFILRWKQPNLPRPYRCTGYPWLPAIYILIASAWTINTIVTHPKESLAGVVIVAIGVPHYLYWKRNNAKQFKNP